jgi:hypothetical protein
MRHRRYGRNLYEGVLINFALTSASLIGMERETTHDQWLSQRTHQP